MRERFIRLIALPALLLLLSAGHGMAQIVEQQVLATGAQLFVIDEIGDGTLRVSGPAGVEVLDVVGGAVPEFGLFDANGNLRQDGSYTWELRLAPALSLSDMEALAAARETGQIVQAPRGLVESGNWHIRDGSFAGSDLEEAGANPAPPSGPGTGDPLNRDFVIADDLIVDGSACIGFDCVNGEVFGFDTIRLKENNLRIKFDDTSTGGSFPRNDWQLTANESANGGASKFSIDDITGGRTPFTVEANAPSHSLYVDDGGRIGNGTSTPSVEIHTIDGDTPTLRLQQDGSSGFAPQTWDVAGNETSFFVRDVSNGSTLPFRIRPGAPSEAIVIEGETGDVGFGTLSPDASLHILTIDASAQIHVETTNADAANDVMVSLESAGGAPIMQFVSTFNTWSFTAGNFFTIANPTGAGTEFQLDQNGNVTVTGSVTAPGGHLPDYVFEPDYELMPLDDLAEFVKAEKHLPNVPSLDDMKKAGGMINMNDMQNALLEKVEELTLYLLSQNDRLETQSQEISGLRAELESISGTASRTH